MPFIGETERHKFGLLRPDTPIRDARHHLRHIVNCGEKTILIDSSIEKSSPLASPVEELLHMCEDPISFKGTHDDYPSPRDQRQADGRRIREMLPPNNPH